MSHLCLNFPECLKLWETSLTIWQITHTKHISVKKQWFPTEFGPWMNAHSSTLYFSICPKTNSIQHGYIRVSREKLKRIASRQANNTKIKQKHYNIWAFTSNPVRNVTGINTPWTGRNKKFILKLHMTLNINFTSSLLFSTPPPPLFFCFPLNRKAEMWFWRIISIQFLLWMVRWG